MTLDPTVIAIPTYFGTMGAEYAYLRRRAERDGPTPADYERRDTITSLTMGVGSLLAPLVLPKLLRPITPGVGRYGKVLLATAAGAVAVTTVADLLGRLDAGPRPITSDPVDTTAVADDQPAPARAAGRRRRRLVARAARTVAKVAGVTAVAAGVTAAATTWTHHTSASSLWRRRVLPDLGNGPVALAAGLVGWDFIYYWNHRFSHESRLLWAIHVVHHSSEHYNLSTALRQPVLDAFGLFVPYGLMSLLGIRPSVVLQARGLNLLYQYWFHTDTIRTLGPAEAVLNTPSHHRVHHGSNPQYLDRNHGSILITWDRLFGTFEPEDEPVVYGLTKNLDTFNPGVVATHEHVDMLRDVAGSTTWSDRLSYVVRGPGWAYERDGHAHPGDEAAAADHEVPALSTR